MSFCDELLFCCGGNAFRPFKIQSHDAAIVKWELQRSGALLFGDPAADTAVHFVRQPIFAGDGFEAKDVFDVLRNLRSRIVHLRNACAGRYSL